MNTPSLRIVSSSRVPSQSREATTEVSRLVVKTPVVPRHAWYLPCKNVLDILAGFVMLVVAVPIILAAAVCIKLTSRGPVFYSQQRLGKGGIPFRIFKLRTMVHNAEALTGPVWSQIGDQRVTWVGKWLRDLHVDEFPQLVNVLLGQMSLVGPRPERPEFIAQLDWKIPEYSERLRMRPGVTGLAQLNLPPDSDLESVRKKLMHDLYYIRNCNPWLDFKIILFTAGLLFKSCFRHLARGFVLPGHEDVTNHLAANVSSESEFIAEQTQA